jgi:hypothetical protein
MKRAAHMTEFRSLILDRGSFADCNDGKTDGADCNAPIRLFGRAFFRLNVVD